MSNKTDYTPVISISSRWTTTYAVYQ